MNDRGSDVREYLLDLGSLVRIHQMSDYVMTAAETDLFLDKLIEVYWNGGMFEVELGEKENEDDSIKPHSVIKTRAAGTGDQ